jgi:hypothetical protein
MCGQATEKFKKIQWSIFRPRPVEMGQKGIKISLDCPIKYALRLRTNLFAPFCHLSGVILNINVFAYLGAVTAAKAIAKASREEDLNSTASTLSTSTSSGAEEELCSATKLLGI